MAKLYQSPFLCWTGAVGWQAAVQSPSGGVLLPDPDSFVGVQSHGWLVYGAFPFPLFGFLPLC